MNGKVKKSISYYDQEDQVYKKVIGNFNDSSLLNRNFVNWLYSKKLDYSYSGAILKEGKTTADLIQSLQKTVSADSDVLDLGNITSLFVVPVEKNVASKEVLSRFLGLFQVEDIYEFSDDEYSDIIRISHSSSFPQPSTSEKMTEEMKSLHGNSVVIAALGYQPEVAMETQEKVQEDVLVDVFQKVNKKVV